MPSIRSIYGPLATAEVIINSDFPLFSCQPAKYLTLLSGQSGSSDVLILKVVVENKRGHGWRATLVSQQPCNMKDHPEVMGISHQMEAEAHTASQNS